MKIGRKGTYLIRAVGHSASASGIIFSGLGHLAAAQEQKGCYYGIYINEPQDQQIFSFDPSDTLSVSIDYMALPALGGTCQVSWSLQYSYTTSGGVGPFTSADSFQSQTGAVVSRKTGSHGGMVQVAAVPSGVSSGPSRTIYVAGNQIANGDITSEAESDYQASGLPTTDLLAHIMVKESSYSQFADNVLYSQGALWPLESGGTSTGAAGAHIGLTMVPVSMKTAFDWKANVAAGYATFMTKVAAVNCHVSAALASTPGLQGLCGTASTCTQVEDWALSYYRGFSFPYYIVQQQSGGSPIWVQNPKAVTVKSDNETSAGYINAIRSNTIPN